jgi:hypothetical protein
MKPSSTRTPRNSACGIDVKLKLARKYTEVYRPFMSESTVIGW